MRRPMVFVLLAGLAAMLASVMVYSALKRREAEVQNAMPITSKSWLRPTIFRSAPRLSWAK